jgi:hypothetical protein
MSGICLAQTCAATTADQYRDHTAHPVLHDRGAMRCRLQSVGTGLATLQS